VRKPTKDKRGNAPTPRPTATIVGGLTNPGISQSRGPTDSEVHMNNSTAPQASADPAKIPATYSPIPARDAVTTVPSTTPARGNDEVMSTPAKQS
jgi:hypothetical protein